MTPETLLRLLLVPGAVWLASLAARRWGHTVSGYLGGLPLIGGPITLYLALDYGPAFAAQSATVTLAAILGQAAHLMCFAHCARRWRWPVALAAGWAGFAIVATAIVFLPLTPAIALACAVLGLAAAWRWLPRPVEHAGLPAVPPAELRLRLVAAFVLAVVILWAASALGAVVSGVLLSVPITGSIMPPFTLALYGHDAVARLARGFVVGLTGFTAFFYTLAVCLVPVGTFAAFLCAIFATLVAVFVASRMLRNGAPA